MVNDSTPLIRLNDVSMVYDRRSVLENINLDINQGDFMAITGPNGGGKTTLLRIILKILKPTTGSVAYRADAYARLRVGYLPQKNMIDSRFPVTVREVIEMGLMGVTLADGSDLRATVVETAKMVGMEGHLNANIGSLSGGQLQRTLLGRALISRPDVLVLDEPLSYVDKSFESRLYGLLDEVASDTTILLVSHEMSRIASMANRHVIVNRTLHFCHSAQHFMHYDCCDDEHHSR